MESLSWSTIETFTVRLVAILLLIFSSVRLLSRDANQMFRLLHGWKKRRARRYGLKNLTRMIRVLKSQRSQLDEAIAELESLKGTTHYIEPAFRTRSPKRKRLRG